MLTRPSNRPPSEREVVDEDDFPLIDVEPIDGMLKFADLEPKTNRCRSTCSVQLTNKTVGYVAFKFKASNIRDYAVCPNMGLLRPFEKRRIKLTRIRPRVDEPLVQHPDIFLLQTAFPDLEEMNFEEEEKVVARNLFRRLGEEYTHQFKMRVVTGDDHILPQPVLENQPEQEKSDDEYINQFKLRVITGDDHVLQQATVAVEYQPEQKKKSDDDGEVNPWEEEKLLEELVVISVESEDATHLCEKEEANMIIKPGSKESSVTVATRDQQLQQALFDLIMEKYESSREQFTGVSDVAVMLKSAVVVGLLGFLIEQVLTL